jgi:hydrogenase expression/formation protein HypC
MCLAVPGRITSVTQVEDVAMAQIDFGGVTKEVCLAYVPDAAVGDYVIVHVGFAIQRLDEHSARASPSSNGSDCCTRSSGPSQTGKPGR